MHCNSVNTYKHRHSNTGLLLTTEDKEREKQVLYLSVCLSCLSALSLSLSLSLAIYLSIYLSMNLSHSLLLCQS